jgi:iron complex outermembrane receptor protein
VGTTPALPNPTLRPESVLSEEIAIERRFTDGKVRLSFFNEERSRCADFATDCAF